MNTHEQIKQYARNIRLDFKKIGYSNRDITVKIIKRNGKSLLYIDILDMNININLIRKIADRYNFINDNCTYIFIDFVTYLKQKIYKFLQLISNQLFEIYQGDSLDHTIVSISNNYTIFLSKNQIIVHDINGEIIYTKDFSSADTLNYFIFDLIYYFNYCSLNDIKNNLNMQVKIYNYI